MANAFRARKSEDFTILNGEGKVVGHLRVKPNAILWKSAGARKYRFVTLDQFTEYMNKNGEERNQ